jgi:hypothetical protein
LKAGRFGDKRLGARMRGCVLTVKVQDLAIAGDVDAGAESFIGDALA